MDATPDAWKLLDAKESVPSEMLTAEWAAAPQWVRERSFYMAGVNRAEILEEFRAHVADIAAGISNVPKATKELQEFLAAAGYQPAPGQEGTIKDLRTPRRIAVALATNVKLLQGWAKKERGLRGGAARAFPGWELVRIDPRDVPRKWEERWLAAGGEIHGGRMVALKTDDIWRRIGHMFEDSLQVDYPPFAWNSGMGWRAVSRSECQALGLFARAAEKPAELPVSEKPPIPAVSPVASPNESLQIADRVPTREIKAALAERLQGLAEFRDDLIVFTDPTGTRPYTAEKLAQVVTAKLPDGFSQRQAVAVARHLARVPLAELKDDFARFAQRTAPLAPEIPVFRREHFPALGKLRERLAELTDDIGAAVRELAESWGLYEDSLPAGEGMPHRLVLECHKHGSLRPIYQTAELLSAAAVEKEILALRGTRFRAVGGASSRMVDGVAEIRIEVEEVGL